MPTAVEAAVLTGLNRPLEIQSLLLDDPGPGEVLIEIKAAGICHSDLHYMDGSLPLPLPVVLGHEAAGVVQAIGEGVTSVAEGDHVIPLFVPECGRCSNCLSGKTNVCLEMGRRDPRPRLFRNGEPVYTSSVGTFATHTLMPEISVCKIVPEARFNRAFYCGCGVTTGVGSVIFDAKVGRDDKVVVFGVGGIGLNVIQGARLAEAAMVIAVDTNPAREEVARSFGATHFVNPKTVNGPLPAHLIALTEGGADHSFECIGNTDVMRQASECTNPYWGKCTIVGIAGHDKAMTIQPFGLMMGRSIKGSLFGGARSRSDVPKIVDLYMDQKINIDDLVTHSITLSEINEGIELLKAGKTIRTVIEF